jgi:hypothetical protein
MSITWDQIMNSKQNLMPAKFDYTLGTTPTPHPIPGEYKFS